VLFLSSVSGLWQAMHPFSDVWWSLVTEVQFYALLPLLLLCRRARRPRRAVQALLGVAAGVHLLFLGRLLAATTGDGQYQLADSIVGRGPQFAIGGIAAWTYLRWRDRPHVDRPWWRNGGADLTLVAVLGLLALLLQWVVTGGLLHFFVAPYHAWHVLEATLWASVLLLVVIAPLRMKFLWTNPLLERLGLLSYSIYMWHLPIIWYVIIGLRQRGVPIPAGWSPAGVAVAALIAVLCYASSELTYRVIERPFLLRKATLR
jgi:peptidoglycan/LPS O-acetylase OafA/YrhL